MAAVWRAGNPNPREEMVFPEHRRFFSSLMADDAGRIYVMKTKSVLDESREFAFDVFSKDGYYLCTTELPFRPVLIKHGFVHEIRENKETGNIKIIRQRVKNWAKMKTESIALPWSRAISSAEKGSLCFGRKGCSGSRG